MWGSYTFCLCWKVFQSSWFAICFRFILGGSKFGQKNRKAGWVKTQSVVWTNASYLHLCHQHNCWKRFQVVWMSNLQKTSSNRSKLHWLNWFWKWHWSKALDNARCCVIMRHQVDMDWILSRRNWKVWYGHWKSKSLILATYY